MNDLRYIPEEIERPEPYTKEEKVFNTLDALSTPETIDFNTGPLKREDIEKLRKQISEWPITVDRQPTWEIINGLAYITNAAGFRVMIPEADFREHFIGEDDAMEDIKSW